MSRRCNWCGVFVRKDQPEFTWYRHFGTYGYVNGVWTETGPALGWTAPQILCPDCAISAHDWPNCHKGDFAEVAS